MNFPICSYFYFPYLSIVIMICFCICQVTTRSALDQTLLLTTTILGVNAPDSIIDLLAHLKSRDLESNGYLFHRLYINT